MNRAPPLTLLILLAGLVRAAAPEPPQAPHEAPAAGPAAASDATPEEPDLAEQQLSNAARNRLERARASIVQIRGFLADAASSAFHGSGFAAGDDGMIVTNYHVVAEAVLHPREYRLEYETADGRTGRLQVYAVDVTHDLAIVRGEDLQLPPLRLRTDIPEQGDRAYSIGFPLNLGLTITEGVANGVVANSFEQRIHYTGAINSGMSGGPALDVRGAVYGVNVSLITARQLVGFVVPAKHIPPLLARARAPLDATLSARQAQQMVTAQVLAHQAALFDGKPAAPAQQAILGYTLPTQIAPGIDCGTVGGAESSGSLQVEVVGCAGNVSLLLQTGLEVGDVRFQHRVLHSTTLHPLQFAERVNSTAAAYTRSGSAQHVAGFACKDSLVSLDGFDARVGVCVRQYRLFAGLYDIALTLVSINDPRKAVVSQLDLRGVGFEPGMQFVRRYLEAMRWTPR